MVMIKKEKRVSIDLNTVRFINSPVPSNTYLISIENTFSCIVIDPGSKEETELMAYIREKCLTVEYIILTHEHFDHCWGVNELIEKTGAKVVCSNNCAKNVKQPLNYFNKFYFNSKEEYGVNRVDMTIEELRYVLKWHGVSISFMEIKGHLPGSMCISMGNALFTGDTLLLNTKPVLLKRLGSSKTDYKESVSKIFSSFSGNTLVYPGHGEQFYLIDACQYFDEYFGEYHVNN